MNALAAGLIVTIVLVLMRTSPKTLLIILALALVFVVAVSIMKEYEFNVIVTRRQHPKPSGGWSECEVAKPQTLIDNP
jgi:hypothetical protein